MYHCKVYEYSVQTVNAKDIWKKPFYQINIKYFQTHPLLITSIIYIYIYAFSRRFYPKRLTIAFRLYIFN